MNQRLREGEQDRIDRQVLGGPTDSASSKVVKKELPWGPRTMVPVTHRRACSGTRGAHRTQDSRRLAELGRT